MNFKQIFSNWDKQSDRDVQKANRELVTTKDNNCSNVSADYIKNQMVKIQANKIMRNEQVKSVLGGIK